MGPWPDDLQTRTDVLFVLAGAAPGGDGSSSAPFSTLGAAIEAASDAQLIALGKGTYVEAVTLDRSVDVRGACVGETILQAPDGTAATLGFQVTGESTEVTASNIAFMQSAMRVDTGAHLTIQDIWIHEANQFGVVSVMEGRLTGSGLLIDGTLVDASSGIGVGMVVFSGGTADVDRVHIDGSSFFGIAVDNAGSIATLTRTAVRRTTAGFAIAGNPGSQVNLERAIIELCEGSSVWMNDGQLSLTDVTIRQVAPMVPNSPGGQAIGVTGGTRATLERVVLQGGHLGGAGVQGVGSELLGTDLVVRDFVGELGDGTSGFGLWAIEGGQMTVERVLVTRTRTAGVLASGIGSVLTATDLQVMDTESQAIDDRAGRGISADDLATLSVTRARLSRNRESGVNVERDATATLMDVTIEQTRSQLSDLSMGRGITVHGGGQLIGTRLALLQNREASILVHGEGSSAQLSHLRVEGTLSNECAMTTCSARPGGAGVAVVRGATVEMQNFLVTDNALIGCQVAFGQATFMFGEIAQNPIGLNLQGDGDLDLRALSQGVVFRDNGVNLDSAELPIPDVASPR